MTIEWKKSEGRGEYNYGSTETRFSVQIGLSTNQPKYVCTIFHEDFRYAVYGEEAESLDEAKNRASEWLKANAKVGKVIG
jgi:hypothetical protein